MMGVHIASQNLLEALDGFAFPVGFVCYRILQASRPLARPAVAGGAQEASEPRVAPDGMSITDHHKIIALVLGISSLLYAYSFWTEEADDVLTLIQARPVWGAYAFFLSLMLFSLALVAELRYRSRRRPILDPLRPILPEEMEQKIDRQQMRALYALAMLWMAGVGGAVLWLWRISQGD